MRSEQARLGVVLTLGMGVGPLVIFTLSALAPQIVEDLGVHRVQFGLLATVAYLGALPISLLAARVLRRFDPWDLLVALFLLAAVALVLIGAAQSWWWLCAAALASGVVQSMSNPITNMLVFSAPQTQRRGALMGVKQAGVQMGQLCAGGLAIAALFANWRVAVFFTVPICIFGLVMTSSLRRSRTVQVKSTVGGKGLPREAWWLFLYSFFVAFAVQATNVYLPLFGTESIGLNAATAGSCMAVIGALGIVSRIAWGRASDGPRKASTSLAILAGTSLAAALILLSATITGSAVLLWVGVLVHAFGAIAANVVVIHALIVTVRPDQVASASGYQAVAQYFGFAVGPVTFGVVTDLQESYWIGWTLVAAAYLVALVMTRLVPMDGDEHRPEVRSS